MQGRGGRERRMENNSESSVVRDRGPAGLAVHRGAVALDAWTQYKAVR